MKKKYMFLHCVMGLVMISITNTAVSQNAKLDGYRGIWYTLNQFSEYGDKYSGGLGTYTADHIPIAIYAPQVDKTFFVYGGTRQEKEKHLLIMISYFDHQKQVVPKPVIAFDKMGVDDPHDNATIAIDELGYIWVFVSGRNVNRLGVILKSNNPYCIEGFEQVHETNMTYPQPWWFKGQGFVHLFTKYAPGTHFRELWWSVSNDGKIWSEDKKLAGIQGHYQLSNVRGNRLVTAFNYHVDGHADKRTNIYFMQTDDLGATWKSIDGKVLKTPLTLADVHGPALVHNFEAEGKLVYLNDMNFDKNGNPIILGVVSNHFRPGPIGVPREWIIFHWKNGSWVSHKVCESTNNYDMGSLYVEGNIWKVIGPTEAGPQRWGTGGEMALWVSKNQGKTWVKERNITQNSPRNHSYARRPVNAHEDFYAFWADGHADTFSKSKLYFTNKQGDKVWELPYHMEEDYVMPVRIR
jgi:hypothetical protein